MTTETVLLRPAHVADAEALADLIIQLYHNEAPEILRGARAGQVQFFRYLLEHELSTAANGRFVAVEDAGTPIGSASMRLSSDPLLTTLPPNLFSQAVRSVGLADTLRLIGATLRSSLVPETPLRRDECFIYSVIVTEAQRGRGVGSAMMHQIEDYARRIGVRAALLCVMLDNPQARQLYRKLGYQRVSSTPPWLHWLVRPSELMKKSLIQ